MEHQKVADHEENDTEMSERRQLTQLSPQEIRVGDYVYIDKNWGLNKYGIVERFDISGKTTYIVDLQAKQATSISRNRLTKIPSSSSINDTIKSQYEEYKQYKNKQDSEKAQNIENNVNINKENSNCIIKLYKNDKPKFWVNFVCILVMIVIVVLSYYYLVNIGVERIKLANQYSAIGSSEMCLILNRKWSKCEWGSVFSGDQYEYEYSVISTKCGSNITLTLMHQDCQDEDNKELNQTYTCYIKDCDEKLFTFQTSKQISTSGIWKILWGILVICIAPAFYCCYTICDCCFT
eukprot:265448_1